MKTIREDDRTRLCLDGELTVSRAAELKKMMIDALESSDTVEIDLDEVTGVDLSFLQLACSAHRTAITNGKEFFFSNGETEMLQQVREQAGFIFQRGCVHNPTKNCLWVGGMD